MKCSKCKFAKWNFQSRRVAGHCYHPGASGVVERGRPRLPIWNPKPKWCPLDKEKKK